jgi:hypothetical protein
MSVRHTIATSSGRTEEVELNYAKAIRRKCMECSCYSNTEVAECAVALCPLWPFRFGKDPGRVKTVMSEEQKAAARERLRAAREKKKHENSI